MKKQIAKKFLLGFSLIETILVMTIVLLLLSMVGLSVTENNNESEIVKQEANELVVWLSDIMNQAKLEEADFKIYASEWSAGNLQLTVSWLTGPNATKSVSYKTDKVYLRKESSSYQFTYDGKWQSLSPAVTFTVRGKSLSQKNIIEVTVSGVGYVSTKVK